MSYEVFESWFGDKFIPNLPKDRKTLIVQDNAKYHCWLMGKTPSMKIRKNGMTEFMKKHNFNIPEPIPTKPVLVSLIREAHVPKQYIVDNISKTSGYLVLRLSPYHCMLNRIEMVWSQMKQHCQRQNIYSNEPLKVLDSIREVCTTKISPKNWKRKKKSSEKLITKLAMKSNPL